MTRTRIRRRSFRARERDGAKRANESCEKAVDGRDAAVLTAQLNSPYDRVRPVFGERAVAAACPVARGPLRIHALRRVTASRELSCANNRNLLVPAEKATPSRR